MTDKAKTKKQINREYYETHKAEIQAKRKSILEQNKKLIELAKNGSIVQPQQTQEPKQEPQSIEQEPQREIQPQQTEQRDPEQIKIMPVIPQAYKVDLREVYIEQGTELFEIKMHGDLGIGIIAEGSAGTGKTLCGKTFAHKNDLPLIFVPCNEYMTDSKLIGTWQLKNGESVYCLGAIPTAIECANKSKNKEALLLLDELNTLNTATQKILNETLNVSTGVIVPALNKVFKLDPDAKLYIYATQNPTLYSGTNELNKELQSRFHIVKWSDLNEEQTKELLKKYNIEEEIITRVLELKAKIKTAYEAQTLNDIMDTRELVKFCKVLNYLRHSKTKDDPLTHALKLLVGKFSVNQDSQKFVYELIEGIFSIEI